MAPRKRQRPNPTASSSTSLPLSAGSPATTSPSPAPPVLDTTTSAAGELPKQAGENRTGQKTVRKSQSWYGSWPRAPKASASRPQLARESILGLGGSLRPSTSSTSDLQKFDTKRQPSDASSLHTTTDLPSTSLPNIPETDPTQGEVAERRQQEREEGKEEDSQKDSHNTEQKRPVTPNKPDEAAPASTAPTTPPRPTTSSGWLSWLARSPLPGTQPAAEEAETAQAPQHIESASEQPASSAETVTHAEEPTASDPQPPVTPKAEAQPQPTSASWFPFWGATPKPETPEATITAPNDGGAIVMPSDQDLGDTPMPDAPQTTPDVPAKSPPPTAGSTWAFWSRDVRPDQSNKQAGQPQPESGELAVIGQGSEARPQPSPGMDISSTETAKDTEAKQQAKPVKDAKPKLGLAAALTGRKTKRGRPQSMDLDESSIPSGAATPQQAASSKSSIAESVQESASKHPSASKQAATPESPAKTLPPNLLLPSFGSTYRMKDNPSIIKQITQLLLRTQQPPANHVFKTTETPKIKKAIAIGVHGLFPATYLRAIIGQPTGTSLRFANHCAEGIRRWADAHGSPDCEIEKVALEGEGKVAERVDNLWKLLLNWIEHLRSADLIIMACHSQGVPVAVMLLAKLIDLGIITGARIGVCAMAGVNLGPFPDYKSSMGMLMGTGAELWEFCNPDSDISKRYESALKDVLEYGARITFVGSIDDQLVPMESAVYSTASHPYIYRAVFIDGRVHAPDFIAHLVGFALKLRNLGVSDHGLIRELSTPLAGSLYSGEGHSRLYYDEQVYDLAVAHALETTDIPLSARNYCHFTRPRPVAGAPQTAGTSETGSVKGNTATTVPLANPNPYHLPWIMRGLLEENFVKSELSSETEMLLKQFDDWRPVTKALKDVKYRLEAVRSRL